MVDNFPTENVQQITKFVALFAHNIIGSCISTIVAPQ